MEGKRDSPFRVAQAILRTSTQHQPISSQNLHNAGLPIIIFEGFHCGHGDENRIGAGLRLLVGKIGKLSRKLLG